MPKSLLQKQKPASLSAKKDAFIKNKGIHNNQAGLTQQPPACTDKRSNSKPQQPQ
jgi:hypothetical protein